MNAETRRIVQITAVTDEAHKVRTLTFRDPLCAAGRPGQFVMAWVPSVDEVPMSISKTTEFGEVSVTVEALGEASNALYEREVGDEVGVMGPLGRGFTLRPGKAAMVAGGMGVVPLAFLVDRILGRSSHILFILGARTRDRLVFVFRLEAALSKAGGRLVITTEDGSMGRRGTATEAFEALLRSWRPDSVYTCGPDAMVVKVFRLAEAHAVPVEASLQAYMKCAVGLCGSCCVGPYLVCKDGPVFSELELREMPELGLFRRDATGAKVPLMST